jgi:DNA replication protein DnaC
MAGTDELVAILKKLRLSGVLQTLDLRKAEAIEHHLTFDEFLERLLRDEVDRRDGKQLDLRVRRANFEHERTLEGFDFRFNPDVPRARVVELGSCAFIDRREDVLFIGPTGTGKSHLAQALGHRACRLGMSVLFLPAQELFAQLHAARGDGTHDRKMQRLCELQLLIVDDLGLRPLRGEEPYDLHELVRARHERRSTIFTSNRAPPEWQALFPDPLLAAATMDRLLHHAHVVELVGQSYRNPRPGLRAPAPG